MRCKHRVEILKSRMTNIEYVNTTSYCLFTAADNDVRSLLADRPCTTQARPYGTDI